MGVGMPGDRRGVRREEGERDKESKAWPRREDRGRKKEEVSHLSATACRKWGQFFLL